MFALLAMSPLLAISGLIHEGSKQGNLYLHPMPNQKNGPKTRFEDRLPDVCVPAVFWQ